MRMVALVVVGLGAGCASADTAVQRVVAATPPLPKGRLADPLVCPDQRPPVRTESACDDVPLYLGGHGLRITRPLGPTPPPSGVPRPHRCGTLGIVLCDHFAEVPTGSYALMCRDPGGELTGGARLVAPDGSVVTEGACDHGGAIGARLSWSGGRLIGVSSMANRMPVGLGLFWQDGRYQGVPNNPPTRVAE